MVVSSYAESRSTGKGLNTIARAISNAEEKARFYDEKARAFRKEGRDDSILKSRAQSNREEAQRLREEYATIVGSIGEPAARQALKDAPKNYFSGYEIGSGRSEQAEIRREQSRSFVQARELAKRQAGIYQYRSGGSFISQAGTGTFLNDRNEVVSIREPIGSSVGGGFIYPSVEQPRTITGLNLFDTTTQDAVRERAGSYATAGAIFASATPAGSPSFSPTNPPVAPRSRTFRDDVVSTVPKAALFFSLPGSVQQFALTDRLANRANEEYLRLGFGNQTLYENPINTNVTNQAFNTRFQFSNGFSIPAVPQPFRSVATTGVGVLRGVVDIPNEFARNPYQETRNTLIAGGVGVVGGAVAGRVIGGVASRSLPTARFLDVGTRVGFGGFLAYETTQNPEKVGRELPLIVAGASGFSGSFPAPKTEFLATPFARSSGAKFGETPGMFRSEIKVPLTVRETNYGITRTIQPTSNFFLESKAVPGIDNSLGNVPVRLRGSVSYNSFISGEKVKIPVEYEGFYRFGGFQTEPAIIRKNFGGVRTEQLGIRRPNDLLVLTRGSGQNRETFTSEIFSQDFRTSELGTYDITAGFRTTRFRGSRNPEILGVNEGGVRLVGLNRRQPSVDRRPDVFGVYDSKAFDIRVGPTGSSTPRVTFPFESQSFRTRAVTLEATGAQNVRVIRPEVNNQGFGILRRFGSYRPARRPVDAARTTFNEALFSPRAEYYSGFGLPTRRNANLEVIPETGGSFYRPSSGRLVGRRSLPIAPLSGFAPSGFRTQTIPFLASPVSLAGRSFGGQSLLPSSSSLFSIDVTDRSLPRSAVDLSTRTSLSEGSLLSTRSSLVTTNDIRPPSSIFFVPTPVTPTPPPEFPPTPGVGVPLFGAPGRSGVEGRGRKRGFRYAPSVNAILFNVRGRKPTKPLGGFETRPILTR